MAIALHCIGKYLLQGLVGAFAKVPLDDLYLKCEVFPLSYLIFGRTSIYLKTVLKRAYAKIMNQILYDR